jgi:hypothetical protein
MYGAASRHGGEESRASAWGCLGLREDIIAFMTWPRDRYTGLGGGLYTGPGGGLYTGPGGGAYTGPDGGKYTGPGGGLYTGPGGGLYTGPGGGLYTGPGGGLYTGPGGGLYTGPSEKPYCNNWPPLQIFIQKLRERGNDRVAELLARRFKIEELDH